MTRILRKLSPLVLTLSLSQPSNADIPFDASREVLEGIRSVAEPEEDFITSLRKSTFSYKDPYDLITLSLSCLGGAYIYYLLSRREQKKKNQPARTS